VKASTALYLIGSIFVAGGIGAEIGEIRKDRANQTLTWHDASDDPKPPAAETVEDLDDPITG
jgi:hypothetical protein